MVWECPRNGLGMLLFHPGIRSPIPLFSSSPLGRSLRGLLSFLVFLWEREQDFVAFHHSQLSLGMGTSLHGFLPFPPFLRKRPTPFPFPVSSRPRSLPIPPDPEFPVFFPGRNLVVALLPPEPGRGGEEEEEAEFLLLLLLLFSPEERAQHSRETQQSRIRSAGSWEKESRGGKPEPGPTGSSRNKECHGTIPDFSWKFFVWTSLDFEFFGFSARV